ncbi:MULTISPECIES: ABC-type transport auxiliary lipoprotein family protein [Thiorhodovibrio]|uniref:ABC-type transport auxiliary lipoprotein family protein n=1 Tax=Thiorhodovibrio TaxID=61593 RepID=UPI00191287E5|nr:MULTISPECIES: hypothetical protein [Thiorhodovibrio]MBK5970843.1 hypothetical protein [Thiorhodovibrio winogradskyi]
MGRLTAVLTLVLMVASLLGGCAFRAAPPALMYRLSIASEPAGSPPPVTGNAELLPLRSNRPQGGSLGILIAQVGEVVRVEEFTAGRWEESPETVIERALTERFSRSGESAVATRPRLRPSLDQFELVEPVAGDGAHAAVTLSFQLLSPRDRLVLATGEIHEREPLSAESLTAGEAQLDAIVLAFNRASSRAVARFAEALSRTLR